MPRKVDEKDLNIKSLQARIHVNDLVIFKKLIEDLGMSYQNFFDACVTAFMRGDPGIVKAVRDWKTLSTVPKEWKDKYTLSHRERSQILDEIEFLEKVESGETVDDDS